MIFWHAAGSVFLFRWIFRDPGVDLRFLILGALLPDLVDKPLTLLVLSDSLDTSRAHAHTLLFAVAVLLLAMLLTRRGTTARKRAVVLAVGVMTHLVLDAMWVDQETFLWPLFGFDFPPGPSRTVGELLANALTDPVVIAQEVVGIAYLTWLWRRADLGDRDRRHEFVHTGRISLDAPEPR